MLGTISISLALALGINGLMFLIAFWRQSDKLTDASYAVTFITLAIWALLHSHGDLYDVVGTLLVCLWALRIGIFLLQRVIRVGYDRRFDGMREHFWRFGKFWIGQALTAWLLMLPLTLALAREGDGYGLAAIGVVVWLVGFVIEAVADLQKSLFTRDPAHKGQWMDRGIWRYSRHPNYFGEIVVWLGIYMYSFGHLSWVGRLVGILSPLSITLLLRYVSGIPILEKSADKKWGNDPSYRKYKESTSLLVPLPRRS